MSSPWAAPRLIIHGGAVKFLLKDCGIVDEIMYRICSVKDDGLFRLDPQFAKNLPSDPLLSNRIKCALTAYSEQAGNFMKKWKVPTTSWLGDARWLLRSENKRYKGDDESFRAHSRELSMKLRDAPQGRLFQVVLLLDGCKEASICKDSWTASQTYVRMDTSGFHCIRKIGAPKM